MFPLNRNDYLGTHSWQDLATFQDPFSDLFFKNKAPYDKSSNFFDRPKPLSIA